MNPLIRDILSLLDKRGRQKYGLLMVLSVISSLLQTLGVAAISLFFTVLLGGNLPSSAQALVGELSFERLGLVVLACVVAGTTSSAIATYWGIKLAWEQYHQIALRLMARFLGNSYEWHIQRNSSTLTNTVIFEAQNVVNNVLQQIVLVLVRGCEIVFIGALLFATRPAIALVSMVAFSVVYGSLYSFNRKFVQQQGCQVEQSSVARCQAVAEAMGGLKAVKVLRCERYFLDKFQHAARRFSAGTANIQYFSLMPKYLIEMILFGGLIGFVVISHSRSWQTNESVPLLALYGAAAIRLLPAAQQLYASLTVIVGASESLRKVLEGLKGEPVTIRPALPRTVDTQALVVFENVGYTYPEASQPSLKNLSFSISPGEKIGVVGITGAGKTTLVDLLLGLLSPTEGQVLAADTSPNGTLVGYVPQDIFFVDDTIAGNIALGQPQHERDHQLIRQVAVQAHIDEHIQTLPLKYQTPMGEDGIRLSGGQRQRIGIARALYTRPALVVLDEASNALDAETEHKVVSSLLQEDITMIVIAHRLSILRGCTRIIVLESGEIVAQGTYDELAQEDSLFQRLSRADTGQILVPDLL